MWLYPENYRPVGILKAINRNQLVFFLIVLLLSNIGESFDWLGKFDISNSFIKRSCCFISKLPLLVYFVLLFRLAR